MLIFITGYMGAGKTTLGKQLAERLAYHFYDMDEMIEISSGYSIETYFEKFGEASFRHKEREILLGHLDDNDTVIATGGGTACFADNMVLMNAKGITVYIDVNLETIMDRLSGKIHLRPLLKHIPPDQLPMFIKDHLAHRMEFYNQALIRINGEAIELDELIDAIKSFGFKR